jgi:hypothetical protein
MAVKRAPSGLGQAGKQLWRETVAGYELSPAELATLGRACRTADLLARVDEDLAGDITSEGSMGQVRSPPLLRSYVELSQVLDAQLRSLCLPLAGEDVGHRRSPAAVAAAQARWRDRRGTA